MAHGTERTKSELGADEINRYWDAYFAVVDGLIAAENRLQELENGTTNLGERSGFRADRLRVGADLELMRARRIAFNSEQTAINPPSQTTVSKLIDLVAKVSSQDANRQGADAIVKIVTGGLKAFAAIQGT